MGLEGHAILLQEGDSDVSAALAKAATLHALHRSQLPRCTGPRGSELSNPLPHGINP